MCWFKTLCSVFIKLGLTDMWVSPVLSVFVGFYIGAVLCWFPTNCTCYWLMCSPILLAIVCVLSQTSHLFPMPGLSRQKGCSRWYSLENFKLGNLQPLFRWSDFWENLKSSLGKVCFSFGKSSELFVKFWYDFCGKFVVGKNLKLVNLNVNFKIFSWEILLGIFLPKLVGKILCTMLGVFLKNALVGKLVWNIGESFEILNLGKLLLGILVNLWKYHLGNTWWNLGKFLFGKIL